jgi:hypothetical protein
MNNKKLFLQGNLFLFFIISFLCGVMVKKNMTHHIRIGFDDPQTIIQHGVLYDIDQLEQALIKRGLPHDQIDQQ